LANPQVLFNLIHRNCFREIQLLAECILLQNEHLSTSRLLAEARLDDDRLEEAIQHRDAMREAVQLFHTRRVVLEFSLANTHISHTPCLRLLAPHPLLASSLETLTSLKSLNAPEALMFATQLKENAAAAEEAWSKASARSNSEALLLVAMSELCRTIIRLCCASIAAGDDDLIEPLTPSTTWENQLSRNIRTLRGNPAGARHLGSLTHLIHVARYTHAHMVADEVKALVSPTIAEVMSLLDRAGPSDEVQPIDRRKTSPICSLSGLRLDRVPPSCVVQRGNVFYHVSAAKLFERCVGPLPG